jgi:hypothetical protein
MIETGELVEIFDMPTLRDGAKRRQAVNAPLLAEIVRGTRATKALRSLNELRENTSSSMQYVIKTRHSRDGGCWWLPHTNLSFHACALLFRQTVLPLLQNVLPNAGPCHYLCS